MRQYETGYILSPTISEEETISFIRQMADIVTQKGGRMIRQDVWGKRRLAFSIHRFNEGFYVFFTYEGEGDISLELERRFKQSEAVIRFLTVKKDPRDMGPRKNKNRNKNKDEEPAETVEAAPAPETENKPVEEKQ